MRRTLNTAVAVALAAAATSEYTQNPTETKEQQMTHGLRINPVTNATYGKYSEARHRAGKARVMKRRAKRRAKK